MARILVIDDDDSLRTALQRLVEKDGHEVIAERSGEMGIQRYKDEPIDLVITDIFMPNKSGLRVIQEIRQEDPDAKIVVMTSFDETWGVGYLSLAKQLGANRTFSKPFEMKEMEKAVTELLEGGSPR